MEFINNRTGTIREFAHARGEVAKFVYLFSVITAKINAETGLAGSLGVFLQSVVFFFVFCFCFVVFVFSPILQTRAHHKYGMPFCASILHRATFNAIAVIKFSSHNRIVIYCSRLPRRAEIFLLFGLSERDFYETSRKR
jgi:hypothetical protein